MSETKHATRKAYSLNEVAEMFGRHRSWAYRQARSGRIRTIIGFGKELIPSSEIQRILGETPVIEEHAP